VGALETTNTELRENKAKAMGVGGGGVGGGVGVGDAATHDEPAGRKKRNAKKELGRA